MKPGDEGDDVGVEGEDAGAVPLLVGGADGAGGSDDASFPPPLAPWPVELRAASISSRSVRAYVQHIRSGRNLNGVRG